MRSTENTRKYIFLAIALFLIIGGGTLVVNHLTNSQNENAQDISKEMMDAESVTKNEIDDFVALLKDGDEERFKTDAGKKMREQLKYLVANLASFEGKKTSQIGESKYLDCLKASSFVVGLYRECEKQSDENNRNEFYNDVNNIYSSLVAFGLDGDMKFEQSAETRKAINEISAMDENSIEEYILTCITNYKGTR